MHVICNKCRIITNKKGIQRTFILDFKKILSHKALSDERIPILEKSTTEEEGTTIELVDLKKTIDEKKVVRRIARNMPLSPDFQVIVNKKLLKPEDIINGKEYEIELDLPLTGKVMGKLIHSDKPLGEFAGIYIKVYGRTVNADDPNIFDLMNTIARPGSFVARLYGILHADGLDDIVLATRNGFNEDSTKFIEFKAAVLKRIREVTKQIQASQSREELDYEKRLLDDVVRHQVDNMLKGADLPEDFLVKYSRRSDAKKVMSTIRTIEERKQEKEKQSSEHKESKRKDPPPRLIRIGNRRYRFELENLGKEAYECILDVNKSIFYINIDHPQYMFSRREGSLAHHFRRVIIFEIARAIAGDSLAEFVIQYAGMMLQEIKIEKSGLS